MDIQKLSGTECGTEIAMLINEIIDKKSTIDLDNLSEVGEQRFTDLLTAINSLNTTVSNLNTTVGTKLTATVSKAANGYIKFNNGVIIQWGNLNRSTNLLTIKFPIAFSTTNYSYIETAVGLNVSQFDNVVISKTVASCTTYCSMKTNEKTAIMWISIGY